MDLYAENILDHYRHPRGKTQLEDADITHEEINTSCGDELTVQCIIADNKIQDCAWQGQGCAISQAGMSLLFEKVTGMTLEEIDALPVQFMHDLLGVPVGTRRLKCALLGLHAVKNAIRAHRNLEPQSWEDTIEH